MKSKYILIAGIILLTIGIFLRAINQSEYLGLSLIIIGVIFKLTYIITKIINGEYKPDIEIFVLALGLLLFFLGLYYIDPDNIILKPLYFIILGIIFKIIFIIKFIQIIRSGKKN